MNYKIISLQNHTAIIDVSIPALELLEQLLGARRNLTNQKLDDIKSRRKIIPYFLNKFHDYVIEKDITEAKEYLNKVKTQKKSKQKKFELCDIRNIFNDRNLLTIQQLWIQFLGKIKQIIIEDTRIKKNQELYLSYIPILLTEASKNELAYYRFLSEKKSKQKLDILIEQQIFDSTDVNISSTQNSYYDHDYLEIDHQESGYQIKFDYSYNKE